VRGSSGSPELPRTAVCVLLSALPGPAPARAGLQPGPAPARARSQAQACAEDARGTYGRR